jgi:hypothetical protein
MTENPTPLPDVTIFEGDQGPEYVRWIERHPLGTVLVIKSTEYGTIHDADCWHIGAPSEPRASVGRTKVCGKMGPVKKWARDKGIKTDWCQSCQG